MMFNKLMFFLTKPELIVILGPEKEIVKKTINQVLKNHFKKTRKVFVFLTDEKKINDFSFYFKSSKLAVLVITGLDQNISLKNLPLIHFVLNYNDQKIKEIKFFDYSKVIKFGDSEKNDIIISDIKQDGGTNLKITYKGSIVPFWFKKKLEKTEIDAMLSVVGIALLFNLNLVEISQLLREIY
jgi:hypothetical protein